MDTEQLEELEQAVESLAFGEFILALAIFIAFVLLSRWVRRRLRKYLQAQEGLDQALSEPIARVTGWAVVLVGALAAVGVLGYNINPLLLLLLLIAVIAVLTGRRIVENFAAGLLLQMRGPFRVGDRIETKDYTGKVLEINARSVRIRTGDRRMVHVPNSDFLEDPIVNYTEDPVRRSSLDVGVAYDTDLAAAKALLVESATSSAGVHKEPPPRAFITGFGDSAVDLVVQFWHDDGERWQVRDRVAEAVKAALDDAGVDMPYPHQVVDVQGTNRQSWE